MGWRKAELPDELLLNELPVALSPNVVDVGEAAKWIHTKGGDVPDIEGSMVVRGGEWMEGATFFGAGDEAS